VKKYSRSSPYFSLYISISSLSKEHENAIFSAVSNLSPVRTQILMPARLIS